MKRIDLKKSKLCLLFMVSFLYCSVAEAAFGQKFATKLTQFNNELVIIAAIAFVTGVICLAITMLGGGNERIKRWGTGLVVAGILCFIAPDLGNFFFR